jgi:uncharacterized protein YjbJ (UPF0337 family)
LFANSNAGRRRKVPGLADCRPFSARSTESRSTKQLVLQIERLPIISIGMLKNQSMEQKMNWDRIEGNWKQVTGKVKEQWGKLTEDDLTVVNGKQDQLVGRVQERYGIAKDEAERQVKNWADRLN